MELEDVQATLRMAQVETHGTDHVQKRIPNIHEHETNTTDQYIYLYIYTLFLLEHSLVVCYADLMC